MEGEVRSVSLSAPSTAIAAMTAPRQTPGFSRTGPSDRQALRMSLLLKAGSAISTPASAAGTSPKKERAENRPTTSGGFVKTLWKAFSRASFSRGVPESVMAAKLRPAAFPESRETTLSKKS